MKVKVNLVKICLLGTMFFLVGMFKAVAQRDLLITQAGEEIRCRILDETPTRFIYAYIGKGNKVLRNEIFKNLVTSFKYNYYDTDVVKSNLLPGGVKSSNERVKRVDTRKTKSTEKAAPKNSRNKKSNKKEKGREEEFLEPETIASGRSVVINQTETTEKGSVQKKSEEKEAPKKDSKASVETPKVSKEESTSLNSTTQNATSQMKDKVESTDSIVKEEVAEVSKKEKKRLDKEAKKLEKESKSQLENSELLKEEVAENEFKNYLKFRVGVKGALSNIINNSLETNNAYDLYREKLNKGWTFGADAAYFITEGFGIGGMFTNFMTKNKAEGLSYPNLITQLNVDNGSIATNISNKYVGPVLYFRKGIDFKTFVVLGLSPGMNYYKETGNYDGENFEFNTKQFGGAATLGLDFLLGNDIIGRDIILSLEAGYNYARFDGMNYGDGRGNVTLASPLVMDRLDFSIGLRFMRFPKYLKLSSN